MCFTRKIPKLNHIHSKVLFGHLVQTLAFCYVKHVRNFVLDDTIFSILNKNSFKIFKLKKMLNIIFYSFHIIDFDFR